MEAALQLRIITWSPIKMLHSHWLGAKQETGIKNQLIIQETD
jgi:hypothetical protein